MTYPVKSSEFGETRSRIDLAIVHEDPEVTWYRLIHEKTGYDSYYKWIWNVGPDSKKINRKS